MKKLIFVYLIAIFFITGCDKKKDTHTLITNNYNEIVYPPLTPNTKPIIKQKIKANVLADNKIMNTIIESNSDGFIEKVLADDELQNMSVDYHNKKIHYNGIDATLELDKNNNITGVLGKNYEQLASLSYNKSGQLITLDDIEFSTKQKRIQFFEYANNKVIIYVTLKGKFISVLKIFYNQKGEIAESIGNIYLAPENNEYYSKKLIESNLKAKLSYIKPQKLKPNDVKCIYLNHNEYGDWKNAYCMKGNGVRISTFTRELEY